MDTPKLNRRQFLRLAGAASALGIPALLGYRLWRDGEGQLPSSISPYASTPGTEGPPAPAPLLLLTNDRAENPFGLYLTEILRAEGLNCFQVAPLSAVDRAALEQFSLVLLAEGPLEAAQAELLEDYVAGGGKLIAMRPNARLASLLGLEQVAGDTAEGYLWVDADHPVGQGFTTEALQFHGPADCYRPTGVEVVAWLSGDADAQRDFPAVTLHRCGQGQAAMWAFDLAHSVALTRQGNPAWANQERDGRDGVRAHDAFVGWVDLDRIAVPQADEQMRLLSRLITEMLADVLPLPRLWYFPGTAKTMLIATGDSHGNPAFSVDDVLTRVEKNGGHMSVYYTPPNVNDLRRAARKARWWAADLPLVGDWVANPTGFPSPSDVAKWRSRGHEFTFHPYVEGGVDAGHRHYWREFTGVGYGLPSPTVRTHRVLWTGWVETARVQAGYGLRMNMDFYHIGPTFKKDDGEWAYGHFTGSGLPMKFVDEGGRILNIYQQLTQLVDEHLLEVPWGSHAHLSAEEAIEVSKLLLRRSLEGTYSAIGAQFHVDPFAYGEPYATDAAQWLEGTLAYAATQGVPIWSAEEWLRFTEVRHDANLEEVGWNPAARRLSFRLVAPTAPGVELTVMVPPSHSQARLAQIEVDGRPVEYRERQLSGLQYGWVTVETGSHQITATYA